MKLQVNASGAWRDVLSFDPKHERSIKTHAIPLAKAAGLAAKVRAPSWRITDDGFSAKAYLQSPAYRWRSA